MFWYFSYIIIFSHFITLSYYTELNTSFSIILGNYQIIAKLKTSNEIGIIIKKAVVMVIYLLYSKHISISINKIAFYFS